MRNSCENQRYSNRHNINGTSKLKLELHALSDIPLIKAQDDLAKIIYKKIELKDNDVVIIASTIVAKSENRKFKIENIVPKKLAIDIANKNQKDPKFVQAVLDRSKECLIESPMMLVESKSGLVCINAGIDDSNVENGFLLDLPEDSDKSAFRIGETLKKLTGKKVSIIITDTNGRAFKIGQTGVAIGVYGIHPIKDWCGKKDLFGNILEVTKEAVADEIASAANLLMGEGDGGVPIILLRGLNMHTDDEVSIAESYRDNSEDVIRKGLRVLKS